MNLVQELNVDTVSVVCCCQFGLGVEEIYGWGCHMLKSSLI